MSQTETLYVRSLTVGPFAENCYLVADSASREAILFDPGDEASRILEMVKETEVNVKYILNTHAHIDHVCAVQQIKTELKVPFYLHPEDRFWLEALPQQAAMFGLRPPQVPEVDHDLAEGDEFSVGEYKCQVYHTPGHAPGHVIFVFPNFAICGDTVFHMSIGRTDLPGCDHQALLTSIREKIFTLPEDTILYPGHMGETTVGYEKNNNPFFT